MSGAGTRPATGPRPPSSADPDLAAGPLPATAAGGAGSREAAPTCSWPAPAQLPAAELADRIRAVARPDVAARLSDGVVCLRTWRSDDAPPIVDGLQDGSAAYWIVGMPHPYGPAEAADFLARAERELRSAEYAHLAVTDATSGRVLGAIGMNFRHDRQAGEIGYWTHPAERRRGVARRAVALVTRWAFEELRLPRVELIIHPLNLESQVIASRSGFRREGLLRSYLEHRGLRNDYYSFARLPDDPLPRPHPVLRVSLPGACNAPDSATLAAPDRTTDAGSAPEAVTLQEAVTLRSWRLRDAEAAVALIGGDAEIRRWCIGISERLDLQEERRYIAEAARSWSEDGLPRFAIVDGDDRPLGSIGFGSLVRPNVGQLGYLVAGKVRRRGIATTALSAVTRWALAEGGLTACELLIEPANEASIRVAERAGYARADDAPVRQVTPEGDVSCGIWRSSG